MKYIILLLAIILFSCNSKTENVEKQTTEDIIIEPKVTGGKYFEYDEIEYYKSGFKENEIEELYDNQKKSIKDSLKKEIILGEFPKSISDTSFINHLKSFGFQKFKINEKKFNKIDEIFKEKKHSEVYFTNCIYIYRDILIFKKKTKIIGIAKICFDCKASVIIGTKSNTDEFGMSDDFEKLRKILHSKKKTDLSTSLDLHRVSRYVVNPAIILTVIS